MKYIFGETLPSIIVTSTIFASIVFAIIYITVKHFRDKARKEQLKEKEHIKREYYKVRYVEHGSSAYSSEILTLEKAKIARDSVLFRSEVSEANILFITEIDGQIVSEKIID